MADMSELPYPAMFSKACTLLPFCEKITWKLPASEIWQLTWKGWLPLMPLEESYSTCLQPYVLQEVPEVPSTVCRVVAVTVLPLDSKMSSSMQASPLATDPGELSHYY
jgi:hypothetical protein